MAKNKKRAGLKPKCQSPAAKLELPEDFTPGKLNMPRRGRGKGRLDRAIAAAERDAVRAEAGLPPTQLARVDKAANMRLAGRAAELGLELETPTNVRRLVFNAKRTWRSLENPQDFLKRYEVFQKVKLDPKVFACETPTPGSRNEAEYITWYQHNRFDYYRRQGRLRELRALENVKDWPNMSDIMTSAPFVRTPMSEHQYVEDATNHTRGIFRVLNVPDIARAVLKDLAETGYLDLSNLSRTCHTGLNIVSQYIEHWDETPPGDFLGEDISLDAHDKVQRTPVTLLISPVRQAFKDGKRPDISYAEHYKTQGNLYRALKNRADYITNLQMHRIQFLDLNAVGCVLKSLRNLKLIGIYQCQLLHLGNMAELLDVVKARGQRTGGDSSYVDLDFFPMYHEGPNSIIRHGSYGAVWNHPACDMATGIWQLVLYELYPKARYLDIDILSWGRAFRHFLEKLPMPSWTNVRIYEAIKSMEYRGKENPGELVMTAYNKSEGKWERFADDVTAALRGDNVEPAVVPGHQLNKVVAGYQPERHRKYGWWRDTKRCATCGINVLAVFCPFGDNHCWGCQAKEYLTGQYDHYLSFKSLAAATWFGRCRNLNDVVKTGFYEKGYQIAQELDIFRRRDMTNDHGTGKADWADHADFGRLHRRYAREYEPHGPMDRKLNDKQYMPVGHFPTAITSSMVPACYPEFKLAIWMRDWEIERKKSHPQESAAMRARNRQEELKKQTKRMQNSRENIIQDRNRQDARLIEDEREHYNRRRQWPNRQIKCWDELIQDMFFRSNTIGKDGKPLTMPRWIIEKRPYGPLGMPST